MTSTTSDISPYPKGREVKEAGKGNTPKALNLASHGGSDQEHGVVLMGACVCQEPESREQPGSSASFCPTPGLLLTGDEAWLGHWLQPSLHLQAGSALICFILVEKVPSQCAP